MNNFDITNVIMKDKVLTIIAILAIAGGDVLVRMEGAFFVFKLCAFLVRQGFAFPAGLISMKRTVWGSRVSVKVMTPFRTSTMSVTGVRRAQAL